MQSNDRVINEFHRLCSLEIEISKMYPEMTEHMRSGFVDVTRLNECRHKILCYANKKKVQPQFSSNFEAGDVCDVRLHKSKLKFPAFGNLAVLSIQIK